MLNLDSALELHGVTVFRDYTSQNRFWYMPDSPQLSKQGGEHMFQLLIYREDIAASEEFEEGDREGGGFLTMTVDLEVSAGTLAAVRGELESRVGGAVDLVPVPFERGSVRVTALGESAGAAPGLASGDDDEEGGGSGFVEEILGSATPSLYGKNEAVLALELSKRGALLMKSSIEAGGASQIAMVYNLDYKGLMPARECKITIDFRQSYQHLRSRAQVNTLWFKADIDAEMETLRKQGAITIEDVDYLGLEGPELAERATQLQNLAKELATWSFFRPGLQPGQVLAQDRGELSVYDPAVAAVANTDGFTTPLQTAATGRGNTGDTAGPRHEGRSATTANTRPGGEAPPPASERDGGGDGDAADGGGGDRPLTAVERWNQAGRPQVGFLMRSLTQEEQQTITFDLRQVSAQRRTAAPQSSIRFASGGADLSDKILMVDLRHPFFETMQGTVGSTADFEAEGVRSMNVKVRYGQREDGTGPKDSKEFVLNQPGEAGSFAFHLDHRLSVELEYQVIVHYKAGFALGDASPSATSPWIRTTTRNLDIDPRVVGATFPVTVTAGQVDWQSVRSIQAEVRYAEAAAGANDSATHVLTQADSTAEVHIRPPAGASRKFEVASTYFYESTQEGPILQTDEGAQLVVLNQPPTKAVPISVNLVDPLARIRKAIVELGYENQQTSLELAGDGASQGWTLFRSRLDEKPRYSYAVTVFGNDGTTQRSPERETAERNLIVGDLVEGMLEVEVRILTPDLAAAGFVLAKLRLDYPDAPDWADPNVEKTFEGNPEAFHWKVPKKAGGGDQYTYTMQWFRADGSRETVGPETARDEVLILIPPVGS
ncbi:MAG: hypothetical protein AAF481_12395 [Acidobacteriota bacterium]